MIHGVGIDLVLVRRMREALDRHGERFAWRILAEAERAEFLAASDPARHLAKRFAAKEAFGKAFGSGVAVPATLHAVQVAHDARGRPEYCYGAQLAALMQEDGLRAHLSLSDESEHVIALAMIEHP